jgi:DNA-directed RNA polymerase subunit RPC12/RpoP
MNILGSMYAKLKPFKDTQMEGPYECPDCHGHIMFDSTFVDQVSHVVTCPYCEEQMIIPEDQSDQEIIISLDPWANDGEHCPYCDSDSIHWESSEYTATSYHAKAVCEDCEKKFTANFRLTGYEDGHE